MLTILKVKLPIYYKDKMTYSNGGILLISVVLLLFISGGSGYHISKLGGIDSVMQHRTPFMTDD